MSGAFIGRIQRLTSNGSVWFLQSTNIGRFLESVGLTLDASIESLNQGLALSQPLRCDPSALPVLSLDRGIRIYDTEPIASKRQRLAQWYRLRRQFGTHQGEMRNIQPFFLDFPEIPLMRVVHQSGDPGSGSITTWHTLSPDGTYSYHQATPSNWNWDGQTPQWSRYWAIIYTDKLGLPTPHKWGDGGKWGDGHAWGGLFSPAQIADLAAGLKEAKSAHTKLTGIILATDPTSFDPFSTAVTLGDGSTSLPDGNWGHWSKVVGGVRVPTRLATARYCEGL